MKLGRSAGGIAWEEKGLGNLVVPSVQKKRCRRDAVCMRTCMCMCVKQNRKLRKVSSIMETNNDRYVYLLTVIVNDGDCSAVGIQCFYCCI